MSRQISRKRSITWCRMFDLFVNRSPAGKWLHRVYLKISAFRNLTDSLYRDYDMVKRSVFPQFLFSLMVPGVILVASEKDKNFWIVLISMSY